MPRQCWIDQPHDADLPKMRKHLVTDPIYDGRWLAQLADPLGYLRTAKANLGGNPGAFFCAQGADSLGAWPTPADLTGKEWADWVYDMLQRKIAPGTGGAFPVCHLNPESDDVAWQLAMLKRWRSRSPRRTTVWSPVSHKANIFKDVGAQLAELGIVVAPQCYTGNMERVESSNEVLAWIGIGIPAMRVWPFLDGEKLGHWWGEVAGAIVFSQNRLP